VTEQDQRSSSGPLPSLLSTHSFAIGMPFRTPLRCAAPNAGRRLSLCAPKALPHALLRRGARSRLGGLATGSASLTRSRQGSGLGGGGRNWTKCEESRQTGRPTLVNSAGCRDVGSAPHPGEPGARRTGLSRLPLAQSSTSQPFREGHLRHVRLQARALARRGPSLGMKGFPRMWTGNPYNRNRMTPPPVEGAGLLGGPTGGSVLRRRQPRQRRPGCRGSRLREGQ
jgi:hypothetical protein